MVSGKELDQTVKTATLIEEVPPQMQEHLRLRSEETGTDNKKVILAIEDYVRRKLGIPGGSVDMDIGAVNKGKGQPKGKGKGQPKGRGNGKGKSREPENNENRKCFVCGKTAQFFQSL